MNKYCFESLQEVIGSVTGRQNPAADVFHKKRVVDPFNGTVVFCGMKDDTLCKPHCFESWKRDTPCTNCISARAIREKRPMMKLEADGENMCIVAACPVYVEGRWYSLEMIHDCTETILFAEDPDDQLQQARLYISQINHLVIRDPLTGLYNRRFIDEKLPEAFRQSSVTEKPLALVMVDIDDFKKVNDQYGHPAGDRVLQSIAMVLLGNIHIQTDWVARYGGEEFLVYLHDSTAADAKAVAERMLQAVSRRMFYAEGKRFHVTASFGVHSAIPSADESIEQVITIADNQLLEAKRAGKNRVL